MRGLSFTFAAAITSTLLVGCGGGEGADRIDTYEVTGVVTLGGTPLPGATVTFSPIGEGRVAFGKTDDQGVYTLTTYETGDGAGAGEYKVLVSKTASAAPAASAADQHAAIAAGGGSPSHGGGQGTPGAGSLLPTKYSSASETPFSFTVTTDPENNKFDLKLDP